MRLTVIGCSGSFAGPDSAASCYLVQARDAAGRLWSVVLDLGSGAFGPLQRALPPEAIDAVCLTHLHPDHCSDMSGLRVYSKYHPAGALAPVAVHGPAETGRVLARIHGLREDRRAEEEFSVRTWAE
ncbi:MAG: MBL fold metallo-hydrolase, partial [Bifidobacteriaceae bacterium]|nr:MBL fold metallo-hydrolase [Bifidobacteriaceae bacterium]